MVGRGARAQAGEGSSPGNKYCVRGGVRQLRRPRPPDGHGSALARRHVGGGRWHPRRPAAPKANPRQRRRGGGAQACALLWVNRRPRRAARARSQGTPTATAATALGTRRQAGRLSARLRQSSSMGLLSSWLSSPSCSEEPMRLLRRLPGSKRPSGPTRPRARLPALLPTPAQRSQLTDGHTETPGPGAGGAGRGVGWGGGWGGAQGEGPRGGENLQHQEQLRRPSSFRASLPR